VAIWVLAGTFSGGISMGDRSFINYHNSAVCTFQVLIGVMLVRPWKMVFGMF
jgi:hypothetical protein